MVGGEMRNSTAAEVPTLQPYDRQPERAKEAWAIKEYMANTCTVKETTWRTGVTSKHSLSFSTLVQHARFGMLRHASACTPHSTPQEVACMTCFGTCMPRINHVRGLNYRSRPQPHTYQICYLTYSRLCDMGIIRLCFFVFFGRCHRDVVDLGI